MIRLAVSLSVLLAGCVSMADTTTPAGVTPAGEYTLVSLDGEDFAATATLSFLPDGAIGGMGPCNRWSARLLAPWPAFRPAPVIATERACADLRAEQEFFLALSIMSRAEVADGTLTLTSDDGIAMVFRALP